MNEPSRTINRDDLLKYGGASVLAALVAAVAAAEPADAGDEKKKKKTKLITATPIGLDFATRSRRGRAASGTTATPVPTPTPAGPLQLIKHMMVSIDQLAFPPPAVAPTYMFEMLLPTLTIKESAPPDPPAALINGNFYFYVWT